MKHAILLLVGGLVLAPAAFAAPSLDAVATVDAFHAALVRGDGTFAAGLLSNDALIFEEGEAERTKAAYQASHLKADIAFLRGVRETVIARRTSQSGDLAFVATEGRMQGRFREKPVDRPSTETMVLRRVGGSWRIIHVHWSSHAAKPS